MNQPNYANEGDQPDNGWQSDPSQPVQPTGSSTDYGFQEPYVTGQNPPANQGHQEGPSSYPSYQSESGYQQQPSPTQPAPGQPPYQGQQTPVAPQAGAAQQAYQPTPTPAPAIPAQPPYGTQETYSTGQPPIQPAYQGQTYGQQQPYQGQTPYDQQQPYQGRTPYDQQAGYPQNAYQQPGYSQPGMGPQIPQTPAYPVGAGFASAGEPPINAPWYGIDFINACKRFFRKYATFSGRASRGEYWWAYLMNALITAVIGVVSYPLGTVGSALSYLITLALVVPTIAVGVRRLHDSNMSGLWYLLPIGTAFVGAILLAIGIGTLITAKIGVSVALCIFGGIIILGGLIANIVLMLRPSDPQGSKYDQSS